MKEIEKLKCKLNLELAKCSAKTSKTKLKRAESENEINCLSLGKLESSFVSSGYKESALIKLQQGYRTFNNNENISLPYFYISIPTSGRDVGLENLLKSINNEIILFGYPAEKIIVNVFNDGDKEINNKYDNIYKFKINIRNISKQIEFINDNYPKTKIKKIYGKFITSIDKDKSTWVFKGSSVTMNIARLILNKSIIHINSLVRFIDSDEEFAILIKKNNCFYKIMNGFSIFNSYAKIFENKKINIATGKIVGDPAFSSTQMLRTQILDLYKKNEHINEIEDYNYYHENRSYNDLEFFSKKIKSKFYNKGFPYLPYMEDGKKRFHPFYNILFGHHVTRPILYYLEDKYDKKGFIDKMTGVGDIVWPGNLIFRSNMLKYPSPFACKKIRLHGPIYGYILSKLKVKIYTVNVPCFHNRALYPYQRQQEYRGGTNYGDGFIDLSILRLKQIEGDIVLLYLKKIKSSFKNIVFDKKVFLSACSEVINANQNNIKKIKKLLIDIRKMKNNDNEFLLRSIEESINNLKIKDSIKFEREIASIINDLKNINIDLESWFTLIKS